MYNNIMARDLENAKKLKKEWYERNKTLTIERAIKWQKDNIERKREINTKWREENREQHNATNRKWDESNKPIKAALQAKRKSAILQHTPAWDPHAPLIIAKYQLANMLSIASGEPYHVDHIIPLQGRKVSGLHVFSNLRVIPGAENCQKSNKYPV